MYSLLHLHPHPPFNPSLYSSQSQKQQLVQPRVCHDQHQHEWDRSQFVDVQIKWRGVKGQSEYEWRLSLFH